MKLKTWIAAAILAVGTVWSVSAQDLSALAKVDPAKSQIRDTWGGVEVTLGLSQAVPYRVFMLSNPNRAVFDFREVVWDGLSRDAILNSDIVSDVRFGPLRPGWSRMVMDLREPMRVETAALDRNPDGGSRVLSIVMNKSSQAEFDANSGAPIDPNWQLQPIVPKVENPTSGNVVVMLDPGHGGFDPGAEVSGQRESHLVLTFAQELKETLRRMGGFDVYMTRETDVFVPLEARITAAHDVEADLFLSLHADTVLEGSAVGATAYTMSEEATDAASARLAERHDRSDLLAGIDLSGQDDQIATILMELARLETEPRSKKMAAHLVEQLRENGARVNKRPNREADFAVLKSPNVPSVLLEVGFMSDPTDLANLMDPQARNVIVSGVALAIEQWAIEVESEADLIRQ